MNECVNVSMLFMYQCFIERMNVILFQWINELMHEWMNELMNEWIE
jgi:hypothetical protein